MYKKSNTFEGCVDHKKPTNQIIFCKDCFEIDCIFNRIKKEVNDINELLNGKNNINK